MKKKKVIEIKNKIIAVIVEIIVLFIIVGLFAAYIVYDVRVICTQFPGQVNWIIS